MCVPSVDGARIIITCFIILIGTPAYEFNHGPLKNAVINRSEGATLPTFGDGESPETFLREKKSAGEIEKLYTFLLTSLNDALI